MNAQDYTKAVDLPSIRETKNPEVALSSQMIAALMDACNSQSPIDIRALIVILRGGGLRRAEVVKLELSDFKLRTGALEIRKGRKKTAQFICQNQRSPRRRMAGYSRI